MGIGPSTKETSQHYMDDPLVELLGMDPDIDFVGVVVYGTPQDNMQKHRVGQRTAAWLEAMDVKGAIVSTDGWGNSDIDFINTLACIGERGIAVSGLKFIGRQAQFVVENEYIDAVFDFNKSTSGQETEVVGENTISMLDAKKALAALKLKMNQRGE